MNKDYMNNSTVGEIVAQDYRTASVFKEAGIDFCCGGKKTIEESCSEKGLDPADLLKRLTEIESVPITSANNFKEWAPGFLCDYIVNTHHKYVLKSLPEIVYYTEKIAAVHGSHHPELVEVRDLFMRINNELLQHMKNEEEVLFPAIKEVLISGSLDAKKTIISEISRLSGEHEFAGNSMDKINQITNHYSLPADACNTYNLALKNLEQFEDDLHTHVHLENNILFPRALTIVK